jgi:serine/threonine protein kinase
LVAIKKLLENKVKIERYVKRFIHEMELLSQFENENIIKMKYCYRSEDNLEIYLEYMNYGNLYELIHDEKIEINKETKKYILLQIAKGMSYLHEFKNDFYQNLIHGDLKSANILVDKEYKIKICDFNFTNDEEKYKYFEPHGVNLIFSKNRLFSIWHQR